MFINSRVITLCLLFLVFYFYSLILIEPYLYGDQFHYRILYRELADASVYSAVSLSRHYVGASEPVSTFVLWLGASGGINKDIYISLLNSILLIGIYIFLVKYKTNGFIVATSMLGYYILVLMTGAERLKIAYIFLTWAAVLGGRLGFLFVTFSLFSHYQSFILVPSILIYYLMDASNAKLLFILLRRRLWVFPIVSIIFFVALFFLDDIVNKAYYYLSFERSAIVLLQMVALTFVSLLVIRSKVRFLVALCPMFFFVWILGGERVNMIAFLFSFYIMVVERRQNNIVVFSILSYFVFKSVGFVDNIFVYGVGFPHGIDNIGVDYIDFNY